MRLTMVVRADFQARANEAAKLEDTRAGEFTFTVPLARASDPTTVVAYWAGWDLAATRHSVTRLRNFLSSKGVPVGQLAEDGYYIDPDRRFVIADGNRHEPQAVLERLDLVTIEEGST